MKRQIRTSSLATRTSKKFNAFALGFFVFKRDLNRAYAKRKKQSGGLFRCPRACRRCGSTVKRASLATRTIAQILIYQGFGRLFLLITRSFSFQENDRSFQISFQISFQKATISATTLTKYQGVILDSFHNPKSY